MVEKRYRIINEDGTYGVWSTNQAWIQQIASAIGAKIEGWMVYIPAVIK